MENEYRTAALTEARNTLAEAHARLANLPTWNAKKRDAAEDVEFWGNKVAFLANACG